MPITFRRLQVFVAAAHDCNFRKTADRLGISQPSVSAQIRAIESHLGYSLFARRRGSISTLSHEGQDFLTRARELVKAQRDLLTERRIVREGQAAVLRVSVGPILLEKRVKPRLPEFHERCRNIAMEFVPFNPSSDGERAIRTGAVDVLLYTGGPPESMLERTEIIANVSCSIYGAPDLVERLSARGSDLSAAPFVVLPRDYRITQWFESQLARGGIRPRNIVARPPYMDVALRMALAGKGLAVLFDEHAREYRKQGELVPIGPGALSAHRVMMLGRRALRTQMAPALQFLREI